MVILRLFVSEASLELWSSSGLQMKVFFEEDEPIVIEANSLQRRGSDSELAQMAPDWMSDRGDIGSVIILEHEASNHAFEGGSDDVVLLFFGWSSVVEQRGPLNGEEWLMRGVFGVELGDIGRK